MQAVGELDDDDANILGHGEEHLAEAFRLSFFIGRKFELVQL